MVRIYLSISPSYLHPDENFQGPEVIAGMWKTASPPRSETRSEICDPGVLTVLFRLPLLLSKPSNMGVDQLHARPKRLPSVADVWDPDDVAEVGMGRRCYRNGLSSGDILHSANGDVCFEFCA